MCPAKQFALTHVVIFLLCACNAVDRLLCAYADTPVQPKITTTNNAFKIIIPNVNAAPKAAETPEEIEKQAALAADPNEEKILQFLTEHQTITRKEAQALLDVSQSTAGRILKAMVDNGQIKQSNRGRTTQYCVHIKN